MKVHIVTHLLKSPNNIKKIFFSKKLQVTCLFMSPNKYIRMKQEESVQECVKETVIANS